jgi:hypothetical protein
MGLLQQDLADLADYQFNQLNPVVIFLTNLRISILLSLYEKFRK